MTLIKKRVIMTIRNNRENLILDLGNVLFCIDEPATYHALTELMDPARCTGDWEEGFLKPHLRKYETGRISTELFINGLLRFSNSDVHALDIIKAWNKMLLSLHPKALIFLEEIGRQYNLYLLSNINHLHYRGFERLLAPELSLVQFENNFENCYYSHLIHRRKPDVETYQFVLNDAGISPAKTWFVDDKVENVTGAQEAGLKTIHLHQPCDYSIVIAALGNLRS